jgi:hypothetical protein
MKMDHASCFKAQRPFELPQSQTIYPHLRRLLMLMDFILLLLTAVFFLGSAGLITALSKLSGVES